MNSFTGVSICFQDYGGTGQTDVNGIIPHKKRWIIFFWSGAKWCDSFTQHTLGCSSTSILTSEKAFRHKRRQRFFFFLILYTTMSVCQLEKAFKPNINVFTSTWPTGMWCANAWKNGLNWLDSENSRFISCTAECCRVNAKHQKTVAASTALWAKSERGDASAILSQPDAAQHSR